MKTLTLGVCTAVFSCLLLTGCGGGGVENPPEMTAEEMHGAGGEAAGHEMSEQMQEKYGKGKKRK